MFEIAPLIAFSSSVAMGKISWSSLGISQQKSHGHLETFSHGLEIKLVSQVTL